MVRYFSLFVSVLFFSNVYGQHLIDKTINRNYLERSFEKVFQEIERNEELRRERILSFAREKGVPIRYLDNNKNILVLTDVSEEGETFYTASHNSGAAITTGASNLNSGGNLGLSLDGNDMIVGIWDEGGVGHEEFGNRILSSQGSPAIHSNHVTGTILATGNNMLAKGMASKASAYTYDFSSDQPEMLNLVSSFPALISNHSYGLVTGWRNNGSTWDWFGNSSISTEEDYRFGFYSVNASSWDQIAYSAPYYTMIKSAGNDRSDNGNGTRPPDCNKGTGYDCISDVSTAKNIITVGAVNKVLKYTDANSVAMSSFSSWGPTDDGRIKPDLVAAGVSLYSTSNNNGFANLSGTSMASPNVTGSLLLIQELYKKMYGGESMRSSTLKALAIHTVKEAGDFPGPDYKFGWGLLDVEASAKFLLSVDDKNNVIGEYTLKQGEEFEIPILPKDNSKIKVTMVWTDPPGIPVANSLDPSNLMLVNDLDLRIIDEGNNEQFPWALDPTSLDAAAVRQDNFRDNVEKLEFNNPQERNYKIKVRHKGNLLGGQQNFSLIVEYTSLNDARTVYYWVGGSGDWSNVNNWSMSSGGQPANSIPSISDKVIFDENSFGEESNLIELSNNVSCGSLSWFSNKNASFKFNGNAITVNGNCIIANDKMMIADIGLINIVGNSNETNTVNLDNVDFGLVKLNFLGGSRWLVRGKSKIGELNLVEGKIDIRNINGIQISEFNATGILEREIDISNSTLLNMSVSNLEKEGLTFKSNNSIIETRTQEPVEFSWDDISFNGTLKMFSEQAILNGSPILDKLSINGHLTFIDDVIIKELDVEAGSIIVIESGKKIFLSKNVVLNATADNQISFSSSAESNAGIDFEGYFKLCFDNLNVNNVSITGQAYINAGPSSVVQNATGWFTQECEDVLFPDFSVSYNCKNSLVEFTDLSEGNILNRTWTFPGATKIIVSDNNRKVLFGDQDIISVKLELSAGENSISLNRDIVLQTNSLPLNSLSISGDNLISSVIANSYQWYRDDNLLTGVSARFLKYNGDPGSYFAVAYSATCNRISDTFVILNADDTSIEASKIGIFPNPANGWIKFDDSLLPGNIIIIDTYGNKVESREVNEKSPVMDVSHLKNGIYYIKVSNRFGMNVFKVVVSN